MKPGKAILLRCKQSLRLDGDDGVIEWSRACGMGGDTRRWWPIGEGVVRCFT